MFRLGYPLSTEARCRACVLGGGGVEIDSDREAARYTRLLAKVSTPREVAVGEWLELDPCESAPNLAALQRNHPGKVCPRAPFPEALALEVEVLSHMLSADTHVFAQATLASARPSRARRCMQRVSHVLRNDDFQAARRPTPMKTAKTGK